MAIVPMYANKKLPSRAKYGFEDFDKIFDNFFHNAIVNTATPQQAASELSVALDIAESDKAYLVTADLPGLQDKDIDLSLEDGLLTLSGRKETVVEEENEELKLHRTERRFGSFKRVLQLPADADENAITAELKHGVLQIEISKLKDTRKDVKSIKVKSVK